MHTHLGRLGDKGIADHAKRDSVGAKDILHWHSAIRAVTGNHGLAEFFSLRSTPHGERRDRPPEVTHRRLHKGVLRDVYVRRDLLAHEVSSVTGKSVSRCL